MRMNLSARDRRTVVVGGILLAVILIIKFTLMPWLDHWGDLRVRIARSHATLQANERKSKHLTSLEQRLVRSYGKAVTRPLDDVEETRRRFNRVVYDVLKAGGFKMQRTQPQAARSIRTQVQGVTLLSMRVVGTCQLQQLAKCLAQVRQAEHLIIIDRVDAVSNPKKPTELTVTMVLATLAEEETRR